MVDITKCGGEGCPLKDKCYRYTASPGERQSFLMKEPFTIKDGKLKCEMFWGDQAEGILNQLKKIME